MSEYGEPSFTALAPDRVTVGATLVIVTAFDPAGLNVPSSSVIDAVMVKLFGPSAKVWVIGTDPGPGRSVAICAADSGVVLPSPQLMTIAVGVSAPGSM